MRITICAFDAPGIIDGPTAWLRRFLPFLRNNDIDVRVLFIAANSKKLSFFNELKEKGFPCKLIPWDLFFEEKIIAILDDLRQYPPDIFIPNYFPSACYAAAAAKKAGIPSLIILHNDNDMHHSLVDEFIAGDDEKRLAAVVSVSQFIQKKVAEKDIKNAIAEFITYGAPVPASVSVWKKDEPLKLVYAGRFYEHQKRISDVTTALCRVAKEIPGTECIMYGAGDALQSVLNIIEEKGKELPIKYGGVLNSEKVQDHFLQNHVYILLSDYEGLPISMMEAMACGLVPVCMNIRSGIGELIENGKNGILVKDRDDDFVKGVRQLKNDPVLWQACSVAARKTIIDHFSQEACNKKWLNLLHRLQLLNTYSGDIVIPEMEELKKISLRREFTVFDARMPGALSIPFYRLRKKLGRWRRSFFE